MILQARHHFILYPFFNQYSLWITRRRFSRTVIHGNVPGRDSSILLISNHFSWYDGFWAVYLNHQVFRRKFHFMMLESQLKRNWFFHYAGGFPVRKNSRSVLESIHYTAELLKDNRNLVLVFPQGKMQSMHCQRFEFQRGIEKILQLTDPLKRQVVLMVCLLDYFANQKPVLSIYISEYPGEATGYNELGEAYSRFYESCVVNQCRMAE